MKSRLLSISPSTCYPVIQVPGRRLALAFAPQFLNAALNFHFSLQRQSSFSFSSSWASFDDSFSSSLQLLSPVEDIVSPYQCLWTASAIIQDTPIRAGDTDILRSMIFQRPSLNLRNLRDCHANYTSMSNIKAQNIDLSPVFLSCWDSQSQMLRIRNDTLITDMIQRFHHLFFLHVCVAIAKKVEGLEGPRPFVDM